MFLKSKVEGEKREKFYVGIIQVIHTQIYIDSYVQYRKCLGILEMQNFSHDVHIVIEKMW